MNNTPTPTTPLGRDFVKRPLTGHVFFDGARTKNPGVFCVHKSLVAVLTNVHSLTFSPVDPHYRLTSTALREARQDKTELLTRTRALSPVCSYRWSIPRFLPWISLNTWCRPPD